MYAFSSVYRYGILTIDVALPHALARGLQARP